MRDGDGLLIANFRADRVREIAAALLDPDFSGFAREKRIAFCATLGLVEYSTELNQFLATLFPPEDLEDSFGAMLSRAGLTQLRIAETEKYAHVTLFFIGGRETVFPGEERILVPSPKVATYDRQPEMSAPEVTDKVVEAVRSGRFDVIVMNYANADMVGHTGRIDAAVKAVETVDACLGRLSEAVEQAGGTLVITADHGNAEMMRDPETGEPHTAHTLNPVPLVVVNPPRPIQHLADGRLFAAAVVVVALFSLRQDLGAASPNSAETYKQLNLFGEVFERVRAEYVDDITDNSLVESAINGMLTSLDPHSNYLNTKNFNDMKVQTRGEFGGLGIEVSMESGLVKVVSPIDDTPAARAGLKPGDLITHLDGEPVQGMTLPEAVEKMRGPVSSEIKLTIRREGRDPFDVKLTRATIKIQSVRSHLEGDNIGYIRVTTFNEQTDTGLNNAMKSLKQQAGNKLVGVILDLRNNPGGLLDQAVAVSDAFLEKGEIVSTRGRRSEDAQRYNAVPETSPAGF